MAKHAEHTPETLRELLDYEPDTGRLKWKERSSNWFSGYARGGPQASAKMWNKKFAGKDALNANSGNGYLKGRIFNRGVYAHRAAWMIANGDPGELVIDHIDGDPSNNRLCNLRLVPRALNQRNQRYGKAYLGGVYPVNNRWRVVLANRHIGYFATKEDAEAASMQERKRLGFTEAHGETR